MPKSIRLEPLWQQRHPYPTVDGSFIQSWLVANWTIDRWRTELKVLKEANMTYLILAPSVFGYRDKKSEAIYPTNNSETSLIKGHENTLENCLKVSKELGLKVFIGLNEDGHWWKLNEEDAPWFFSEMHKGNAIAKELYSLYKTRYPETFYGWYWVWEISNLHIKLPLYRQLLAEAINIQLDFLTKLDSSMPLMFCPFMIENEGTPEEAYQAWSGFFSQARFREGDIFCPQDAVGAGWLRMETFAKWFEAMKKACDEVKGLLLWSDVETFRQEDWTSSTLDRFISQLEKVSSLVDNFITFAYCHYYSPFIVPNGYHKAYLHYLKTGKLPNLTPQPPQNLTASLENGQVTLGFTEQDTNEICGYLIFLNGKVKARLQPKPDPSLNFIPINSYLDKQPEQGLLKYEVIAYDYSGNKSQPAKIEIYN